MAADFNINDERIEIPLSKNKLILLLAGALIFVALGLWFVLNPSVIANGGSRHYPVWGILVMGYICAIFFGICAGFIGYKLFDNKPGLIIDATGITDNSSGVSVGHIPWNDIIKMEVKNVYRNKFILLYVNDPDEIIKRLSNMFKRQSISMNYKLYSTPVAISATALKCNVTELCALLTEKLRTQQQT